MSKTKIEWVRNQDGTQGYTINPVKGLCPMACSYCYARRMYKRFKWNPEIRFDTNAFMPLFQAENPRPKRIFIGSTMELFGDWVKPSWMQDTFMVVRAFTQHTFIFLTKQPQNLPREWPDNCWVGVSAAGRSPFHYAQSYLKDINARVRFISFEPLLGRIDSGIGWYDGTYLKTIFNEGWLNWVIIGQQTPPSKKTEPRIERIDEIETACRSAGIPYFEKYNLKSLLGRELIQEFPKV